MSCVTVLLFLVSTVGFHDYYSQYEHEVNRSRQQLREVFSNISSVSQLRQAELQLTKNYGQTGVLTYGSERMVPNAVTFNMIDEDIRPSYMIQKNIFYLFPRYVDWLFVVTYSLSLAALLIAHDAISGELEAGTLKLSLINPLSRASFLLAKFAGMLWAISVPLIIGGSLSLIFTMVTRGVILLEDLITIGMATAFTVLLMAFMLSVGIAISIISKSSPIALITAILFWVGMVLFVPGMSRIASALVMPVAEPNRIQERLTNVEVSRSPNETGREKLDKLRIARAGIKKSYSRTIQDQMEFANKINLLSPLWIYQRTLSELNNTGSIRHTRFLNAVQRFMFTLREPIDKAMFSGLENEGETMKLDPRFIEHMPPLGSRIMLSMREVMMLVILTILVFFVSFVSFARLEVN